MYQTEFQGHHHELGTSGFLYRSNKLMYDHNTKSLWSTLHGEPVVGPLVGRGIKLQRGSVVTTTWQNWRSRHPATSVLSLHTGYHRDYGEGIAYQNYFATDKLMFTVPQPDPRLKNKAEVVALRDGNDVLAIESEYLKAHPLYTDTLNQVPIIVLTDNGGSHRVYETADTQFLKWDLKNTLQDSLGGQWEVSETCLTSQDGKTLQRLPSHRAFWFGWHAQFPNTRLVSTEHASHP